MKSAHLPLAILLSSVLLWLVSGWLVLNEPGNTSHAPHFLLNAPDFIFILILVGLWLGPLLFIVGLLMLILRIRKNNENLHRR